MSDAPDSPPDATTEAAPTADPMPAASHVAASHVAASNVDASPEDPERRALLQRTAACALGLAAAGTPLAIGGLFALDPMLRREGEASEANFRPVAPLAALTVGAPPRAFPVVADEEDAWTRSRDVEIGSVLLFREDDETVLAWSTVCPHLGCRIDWEAGRDAFFCPCHASVFAADGSRENAISPRDMDRLETEVRDDTVWVRYLEYKTGTAEQVPIA